MACTICGDAPYTGQNLLDRDTIEDRLRTCQRCMPGYLCGLCRWEKSPGNVVCLACVDSEDECLLGDNSRYAALKGYWESIDGMEKKRRGTETN